MNEKHKRNIRPASDPSCDGDPIAGGGGSLSEKKSELDALLSSADDAIEKALSHDSETFLNAHRQQGGE
jgi:hypothetical protein